MTEKLVALLPGWLPIAALLIPMLVDVLTRAKANPWVKNVAVAVLSGGTAVVAKLVELNDAGDIAKLTQADFKNLGLNLMLVWASASLAYAKLLKDTPVSKLLQSKTQNFGIGKNHLDTDMIKLNIPAPAAGALVTVTAGTPMNSSTGNASYSYTTYTGPMSAASPGAPPAPPV
jgi:hypothetical protein